MQNGSEWVSLDEASEVLGIAREEVGAHLRRNFVLIHQSMHNGTYRAEVSTRDLERLSQRKEEPAAVRPAPQPERAAANSTARTPRPATPKSTEPRPAAAPSRPAATERSSASGDEPHRRVGPKDRMPAAIRALKRQRRRMAREREEHRATLRRHDEERATAAQELERAQRGNTELKRAFEMSEKVEHSVQRRCDRLEGQLRTAKQELASLRTKLRTAEGQVTQFRRGSRSKPD